MAKDKRDEKQSILGELESIKDLLNEDEFADIPTLSNDLSVDDLNVDDLSANDLADIPVLTQTPDDIPVLKPAHEVTEDELPQLDIPDLDIPELNIPELDVPELNIPELDAPELDSPELDAPELQSMALEDTPDQLTTSEPTLDFNQELNLELDYEAETPPLQLTDSLLEQEIDSVDISTEVAEDLNLAPAIEDFSLEAHSAKELGDDSFEDFNLNEDSSFSESITTVHSVAEDTEGDSLIEDSDLQEGSESLIASESLEDSDLLENPALLEKTGLLEINNTIEASPDTCLLPELSKVPYALPGQQSLFEAGTPAKGKNQTPESSQTENSPVEETYKKRSPKHGSATKARGENPFLPQHIRDRLHTDKTLVDIIKEHPPAPEQKAHPTNHIVEEIIADYMPKIEAELRERLLKLADEGRLDEPPTDFSNANPSSD
jgi:hypothetical protein